jgi:DNA primase
MIPAGFVAELLSRVDIADVVGRHVQLKKGGANLMGLCPFHGEKSPSFSVSPSKQFYYCFGCGASGDAIRFLTEFTGASFRDAVAELAGQVGLNVPDDPRSDDDRAAAAERKQQQATLVDVLERAAQHYKKRLREAPRAVDYFKRRGLTGEIAAQFGLGYAPPGWNSLASGVPDYNDAKLVEAGLVIVREGDGDDAGAPERRYDRFRDRVMFPIRNVQGEVIGFGGRVIDAGEPKYLNSPETPVFSKGQELYGLFEARTGIRRRGYALVVEGYMDVVALAQSGFDNAVATLGTACTADHVRKLFRFTESVVFSFDGDAAGRRAATRALEAALPHATDVRSIKFLFLPPEHDPDSYVRELGANAFEHQVAQAVPLSRQLIEVARQDCDLGTPEGRAKFESQAKPLWQALPEGGFKRQMLAELARTAQLDEQALAVQFAPARALQAPADSAPSAPSRQRALGRLAATRRSPRKPEERIARLLLTQPAWWEKLNAEDLTLLHQFPAPQGPLLAWLERDLTEHGARPWASIRAALADAPELADALQHVLPGDDAADDFDASFEDLRVLLDGRLLEALEAQQRALAPRVAADAAAKSEFAALHKRTLALKQQILAARAVSSEAAGR